MRLPRLDRREGALAALLLLTLPLANPHPRGEGNTHYAYLPSLLMDGDLSFEDEYWHGDADFVNSTFRRADARPWPPLRTAAGRLRNQAAVGAALLWSPAFLQAHTVVLAARALGLPLQADGFGLLERAATALASAALAMLALLFSLRAARALGTPPWAALLAVLAVWLATPLPVYMYFLPFYGHAAAAFVAAGFVWYWLARRPLRAPGQWAVWGALAGLLFATDHMAALLAVVAVFEWAAHARAALRESRRVDALRDGAVCAVAAVAAALPELVAKTLLHGAPWRSGRLNRFFWGSPRLLDVGFSAQHGLFTWTPVLLLAVIGLALLWRRQPLVSGGLMAAVALTYYAVASYEAWHGASSFGNRYFVPLTPVFVVGLGVLLDDVAALCARARLTPPVARGAVTALLALLALWNLGFIFQWGSGMVPRQGPVDFRQVARNQLEAPRRAAAFALRYLRARDQLSVGPHGGPR